MAPGRLIWRMIAVIVLLTLLVTRTYRSGTLGTQSDEGVHITAAQRIAEGDTLYRDLFENRTPLVEWILAAVFKIVGPAIFIGRILSQYIAVITGAILIAIFRVAVRYGAMSSNLRLGSGWPGGLMAAALFALTPLAIFWARFTMLEHWQAVFSLMALFSLFFAAISRRHVWWLAAGAMTGIALLSKQSALTVVAASGFYFILLAIDRNYELEARSVLLWMAGLLIPLAIFFLVLALQGSLNNFFDFISGVERTDPFVNLAHKTISWLSWLIRQPMSLLALIGLISMVAFGGSVLSIFVIWASIENIVLFAADELDLGWGGYSHYALPASVALAILAGFGFQLMISLRDKQRVKWGIPVVILLIVLMMAGWINDLVFVISDSSYPSLTMEPELAIGSAINSMTSEDEAILVLANSVFYHHSGRFAQNLFFHYPEYLPGSRLNKMAEQDLVDSLTGSDIAEVVVSCMHLEERLTPDIKEALFLNWTPAQNYSYPYQHDVILFEKPSASLSPDSSPVAIYQPSIRLLELSPIQTDNGDLLLDLKWQTDCEMITSYTVFTHIIDSDGNLVGQHDGIPAEGTKPTNGWKIGQIVEDKHLIELPEATNLQGTELRIGLYDLVTGKRVSVVKAHRSADSAVILDFTPWKKEPESFGD